MLALCPLTALSCLRQLLHSIYYIHIHKYTHNPWDIFLKGYTILERGKRINKKTEIFIYLETSFSYVALACLELTAVFLPEHLLPQAGITGAMYLKLYEILKRRKELQQAFGLLWLHSNRQSSKLP